MLAIKKTFKWMTYILVLLLTLMTLIVFVVTFLIFPNIDQYKDDIANKITGKIGQKASIGNITTAWEGISPKIIIQSMDIYNQQGQSALHLENIHGTLSWLSIPLMHLHLSDLSVDKPTLHIQRDQSGQLTVAGIPMVGNGEPVFANWLLKQASVSVNDASITWQDDYKQAPPLSLNQFNFKLSNPAWRKIIGQHQFQLSAMPSIGTQQAVHVRGNFYGRDFSKLATWHGNVKLNANDIDLSIWKPWIDYPTDINSGTGKTELTFGFADNQVNQLIANVEIKNLSANIEKNKPPMTATALSGLITWEKDQDKTTITAQKLTFADQGVAYLNNTSGVIYQSTQNNEDWTKASFKADEVNLAILDKLNKSLHLPDSISQPLETLKPSGQLQTIKARFEGNQSTTKQYLVHADFNEVSVKPYHDVPGLTKFSGQIKADEENGSITFNTVNALIDFKKALRWPIPIDQLNGKVTWRRDDDQLKVTSKEIKLKNKHLEGFLNVNYQLIDGKNSYLDLVGKFDNGDAQYAPYYYPHTLNDAAKRWLDKAIVSGKVNNINVKIKGNLKDFPFVDQQNKPDAKLGIFKVTARLEDSTLKYGDSWPQIDDLGLDMRFEGNSMELNANKGHIMGVNIEKCQATIPALHTKPKGQQTLLIKSEGSTLVSEGVKFINNSPVKKVALGFTDDLETDGNGQLKLDLTIPLRDVNSTQFKGLFNVNDGTIYKNARMGIPEISNIFGSVIFNESSLTATGLNASMLGGPATVDIASEADKTIHIQATGDATDSGIQKTFPNLLTKHLSGSTQWAADIEVKQPLVTLNITSNLKGMALALPAPFNKSAEEVASLSIAKIQTEENQDRFDVIYNQQVEAKILRTVQKGQLVLERGEVAINEAAAIPDKKGLYVKGQLDYVNADAWLSLLDNDHASQQQDSKIAFSSIDLAINNLDIFSRSISDLSIKATPNQSSFNLLVNSPALDGNIEWHSPTAVDANGKIVAQLSKLHIPSSHDDDNDNEEIKRQRKHYPALDIKADDFKLGNKALGSLEIKAYEDNQSWVIQKLLISSADSILSADGTWQNWTRNPNTSLNFSLSANDIGGALKRFGQPDTVKGGVALIVGKLAWPGSPHQFKKAGLSGEFTLGASKGQILKVQPGVGRLFGLLTLQSLPRRLTLDFRDLFSEGFAFDEISASASLKNGIMHSEDFHMTGPAAETDIKGDIDLNAETQNLHVRVEPHVSDTVSLAALAGGPIAGVAAFVAQKILKDPLNKIAQSEYTIVGSWDNPIEKDPPEKKQNQQKSPLNAQHQ